MTVLSEIFLEMTFDAGHRIVGHKGKCARLHGHTYRVEIRAVGPVREPGFVVDFGDLKDLVNEWDHQMLLWDQDPFLIAKDVPLTGFQEDEGRTHTEILTPSESGLVRLPFNPTAENMSKYLAEEIHKRFNLLEVFVTLWETPKASASSVVSADQVPL